MNEEMTVKIQKFSCCDNFFYASFMNFKTRGIFTGTKDRYTTYELAKYGLYEKALEVRRRSTNSLFSGGSSQCRR
jgi:hypothetical protein